MAPGPDRRRGAGPRSPRREPVAVRLGTRAGPALGILPDRRLATAVPARPRGEPLSGADRNDPLAKDPRRRHRRRDRPALRPLPGRPEPGGRVPPGPRAVGPTGRFLPGQEPNDPCVRPGDPHPARGGGPAGLRRPRGPPRRRPQDRELRPRLRLRGPGDPGRHPRPSDREPPGGRPKPHRRGDGGSPADCGRRAVLDPAQPLARPARTEPVPAPEAPLHRVPDHRRLRDGSCASTGSTTAPSG